MRWFLAVLIGLGSTIALADGGYVVLKAPAVSSDYSVEIGKSTVVTPIEPLYLQFVSMPGCGGCIQSENVMDSAWMPVKWRTKIRRIKNPEEADRLGVQSFPTWVLMRGNREVDRIAGTNPFNAHKFVNQGLVLYNSYVPDPPAATYAGDVGAAPTPIAEVNRVLSLLPTPEVGYVDFGCGDGRWLIAAAAKWPNVPIIGVEIDPARASVLRMRLASEGLGRQITVITGDATTTEVQADVATMYLYPETLSRMVPRLQRMKAFASYMHAPPGFPVSKNGDTFFYSRPAYQAQVQTQIFQQPTQAAAVWGGQYYSGPVCNSPNCQMCNSIRNQLGR